MEAIKINEEILKMLKSVADKSRAKKRKVGALLFVEIRDFKQTLSPLSKQNTSSINQSSNWMVFGGFNNNRYNNGFCENANNETLDTVEHAEINVINDYKKYCINVDKKYNGEKIMLITFSPCMNCARAIVETGISMVIMCNMHDKKFTEPIVKGSLSVLEYLNRNKVQTVFIGEVEKELLHTVGLDADIYINNIKNL